MYHRLRQRLFAETNTFYTVLKLFKEEPKMHQESFLSLFEFKRVERLYCAIVAFPWTLAPSAGKTTCLLAIVSNRWQDGAKGLESHGDVQQMSSKEEVVEVSKNRHGGVPNEIQERLEEEKVNIIFMRLFLNITLILCGLKLTLSVKTTPSFQMWYFVSMELSLLMTKWKAFVFTYIFKLINKNWVCTWSSHVNRDR